MSYISAEDVLPKEVIEIIQQYVSGKVFTFHVKKKGLGKRIKNKAVLHNQKSRNMHQI